MCRCNSAHDYVAVHDSASRGRSSGICLGLSHLATFALGAILAMRSREAPLPALSSLSGSASCSAHPECGAAEVHGNCCPTVEGSFLPCCDMPPLASGSARCADFSGCSGIDGDCCPTPDGILLGCCLHDTASPSEPTASEHPRALRILRWGVAVSTLFSASATLEVDNAASLIERLPFRLVRTYSGAASSWVEQILASEQVRGNGVHPTPHHTQRGDRW